MKGRLKTPSLFLVLVFCISLIGVPFVYGAIQQDDDVKIGAQLVEKKIDTLMSFLEKDQITDSLLSYIEKWLGAMKSPDVPIYQDVKDTGSLFNSGNPNADQKLDDTIRKVFGLIIENEDLDPETLAAIQEILALLAIGPEAYSPAGIITSAAGDNKGTGKDRSELEGAVREGNFRYYGRRYDLDSPDVSKDPNGAVFFGPSGDEQTPAALSPFYAVGDSGYVVNGEVNQGTSVEMSNVSYRQYQWEVSQQGSDAPDITAKVSANLFENPDNSVIVFDYYNAPEVVDAFGGQLSGGVAGLSPGDGSIGQPGEGQPRDWETGADALSDPTETPIHFHEGTPVEDIPYTGVGNVDVHEEGFDAAPIELDTLTVLRPDRWNNDNNHGPIYSKHTVPRNLVVDSKSVFKAEDLLVNDPESLAHVKDGDFTPSKYEHGIQANISDLSSTIDAAASEAMLESDGFLAYYVQYEEHLMNEEIIDMAENSDELKARLAVEHAGIYNEIRKMDALHDEISDAKAGWVGKDIHGNWTRTHQAILRPNANTVEILNVTHRGNDAGDYVGNGKMNFKTTFAGEGYGVDQDLRALPWTSWLWTETKNNGATKYVVNNHEVQLESMSVDFSNQNGESLKESRNFSTREYDYDTWNYIQPIYGEQLTLNNSDTYDYDSSEYWIDSPAGRTGGFDYILDDGTRIDVSFYVVGDDPSLNSPYGGEIRNIWDALRVNQPNGPRIGDNNLEIEIDKNKAYFQKPIDVVYIPMSRMIWKDKMPQID